jgi:predicted negative regulator of RcsB-dependent stress response
MLSLRQELEEKPESLAKIEQMAGKRKTSRMANLLLATHWVEKGDLAQARSYLEKMDLKPKDLLSYQGRDLMGQVYALQKDYDKALDVYKKMEDEKPRAYTLDVIMFHKAEVLA